MELVILSQLIPWQLPKTNPALNIFKKDNKGWTLVARQLSIKQAKPSQTTTTLSQENSGRMASEANEDHDVRVMYALHQKPSICIALGEFFPKGFFDEVIVSMTSCSKFDDDGDEINEEQSVR